LHNVITVFTRENIPNNKIALWLKLYQEVGKGDSKKERGGIKASGTWRELSDYLIQRRRQFIDFSDKKDLMYDLLNLL
jgi:hypothetical protein